MTLGPVEVLGFQSSDRLFMHQATMSKFEGMGSQLIPLDILTCP